MSAETLVANYTDVWTAAHALRVLRGNTVGDTVLTMHLQMSMAISQQRMAVSYVLRPEQCGTER